MLRNRRFRLSLAQLLRNMTNRALEIWARILRVNGFFPLVPVGMHAIASDQDYLKIFHSATEQDATEISGAEDFLGFRLERTWLENVALFTQVSLKRNAPNWQHGRLLYTYLRHYLSILPDSSQAIILETGTSAGFSAVCMAKAIVDSGRAGVVVTVDTTAHDVPMIWNRLGDSSGLRSRREVLARWPEELSRIIFVRGWSRQVLKNLGFHRIHFAFLDGAHSYQDVIFEFHFVSQFQRVGDIVIVDDVTPGVFDGIVRAVDHISGLKNYDVMRVQSALDRGYAIATRVS